MTRIYVDPTTLIALGTIGELDLLTVFDGDLIVLPVVQAEVTTEPARTNLDAFMADPQADSTFPGDTTDEARAMDMLNEATPTGDVRLVAAVLHHTTASQSVAVVSDDRRIRTISRGLGARVTGTIGVVVRAVEEGLDPETGKAIVRRIDEHGLHMTAELRAKATELIDQAANQRDPPQN